MKLHEQNGVKLSDVEWLVIDEADRLFDLGFVDQIDAVFTACTNSHLKRALFTATLPQVVEELARSVQHDPIRITIGARGSATETIDQKLVYVGKEDGKLVAIRQMIVAGIEPPVMIFVQSIERAKELFNELVYDGINVDVIHAERTQAQRDVIVKNFRIGKVWVLICTELMARGMDFKGVNQVINYDFPQTATSYVHRIGRTGRAGRTGKATTLFTDDDIGSLRNIANVVKQSGCDVPDWMLSVKKQSRNKKKEIADIPIKRKRISTASTYDKAQAKRRKQMIEDTKAKK